MKILVLGAGAIGVRATVGDILHTDAGRELVAETYAACEKTARAAGHAPRDQAMAPFKAMLADPDSPMTASMLRDLEAGGPSGPTMTERQLVSRPRRRSAACRWHHAWRAVRDRRLRLTRASACRQQCARLPFACCSRRRASRPTMYR